MVAGNKEEALHKWSGKEGLREYQLNTKSGKSHSQSRKASSKSLGQVVSLRQHDPASWLDQRNQRGRAQIQV